MNTVTTTIVIESDVKEHIEDTEQLVGSIRNGKLVQVSWNELEDWERRAAEATTFHLYSYAE